VIARERPIPITLGATGTFIADQSANVAPKIPGQVSRTAVDAGDFARKGQLLIYLDDRDARLQLDQAQAAALEAEASVRQARAGIGLTPGERFDPAGVPEARAARAAYESARAQARLAQAEADRYADLVETGDVSRSTYDQKRAQAETALAEVQAARQQYESELNAARQGYQAVESAQAALAAARAAVALAKDHLKNTVIHAPFSGHVSAVPVAPGEFVSTSSNVATLVRIHPVRLELQIPEPEAGRIRTGMTVLATVAAHPGREFRGRLTSINPALSAESRTLRVEATFANPDSFLRPGMFAEAKIVLPGSQPAVFVPASAVQVQADTDSSLVFVVENGRARARVVQLGEREGERVRILAGIAGGERVATSNLHELYDGARVVSG
jgi:RND family efflux transporter MFP subunit